MGQSASVIISTIKNKSDEEIMQLFFEKKELLPSIISAKDQEEKTVLHWAASNGKKDVVKYLVENKLISTNSIDIYNNTPLHSAVFKNDYEISKILIDGGADVNAKDNTGMTPLHWAVENASIECVQILLENGSNRFIKNKKGQDCIEISDNVKKRTMKDKIKDSLYNFTSQKLSVKNEENSSETKISKKVEMMLSLCKIWGFLKYTHPYLSYKNIDWDEALFQALPIASNPETTNTQYLEAIFKLISTLDDPNTRLLFHGKILNLNTLDSISDEKDFLEPEVAPVFETEQKIEKQPCLSFIQEKVALITCTEFEQFSSLDKLSDLFKTFYLAGINSKSIVFDVRCIPKFSNTNFLNHLQETSTSKSANNLGLMFQEAFRIFLKEPLTLPTTRQRLYTGLPEHLRIHPQLPSIFNHGFFSKETTVLFPNEDKSFEKQESLYSNSFCFIVDKNTPTPIIDLAIALQIKRNSFVVYQVEEDDSPQLHSFIQVFEPGISSSVLPIKLSSVETNQIQLVVRQNERINSDFTVGFKPDLIVQISNKQLGFSNPTVTKIHPSISTDLKTRSSDQAIDASYKLCLDEILPRPRSIRHDDFPIKKLELEYKESDYPDFNLRMLSLFRIWNAVEFFYPYKNQLAHTWESVFIDNFDIFSDSKNATEYSLAVAIIITYLCDTHAYVRSSILGHFVGTHVPPLQVKVVEGKTVITHVGIDENERQENSDEIEQNLQVGDIIISIDGTPVEFRRALLEKIYSASTTQANNWRSNLKLLAGPEGSLISLELRRKISRSVNKKDSDSYVDLKIQTIRNTASHFQAPPKLPVSCFLDTTSTGKKIAYLDLTRLTISETESKLDELLSEDVFALVIDIRGYTRGTIHLIAPRLTSKTSNIGITETPILLPSMFGANLQTSLISGQEKCVPANLKNQNFSSLKIIALINQETISHGEYAASILKSVRPDSVIFGTTSNGAVGNITNIVVSGGILIGFTGMGIKGSNGENIQRKGISPDFCVNQSLDDVLNGVDSVLDAALNFIKK